MTNLPIIDVPRRPGRLAAVATAGRCVLVALLAFAIRTSAEQRKVETKQTEPLSIDQLSEYLGEIEAVAAPDSDGRQLVTLEGSDELVLACQTSPASNVVIGYRGASNVLLLLDENGVVTRAELLSSDDTEEHVAAIRSDPNLLPQFVGWTQGAPSTFAEIDATTGATLTSLAIAEGVALRLSGEKPSLRFPDALSVADLALFSDLPEDLRLAEVDGMTANLVTGDNQQLIGRLYRSGTLIDDIAGYQGPSEVLVLTNAEDVVTAVRLRRTFDNEPYAGYLNEDDYFWRVFLEKKFADLRMLDLEAEQVEGVSGATMTSMAVAETVVAAAKEYEQRQRLISEEHKRKQLHWTANDTGTVIVLVLSLMVGLTRLRGVRWLQVCWLLVLVGYFGLVTGNLISLAVLMGWSAEGVAWRLAPGLCAVIAVSLIIPPITKRNLYCTHLCPHGAAQQLLRRMKLPRARWLDRWLKRRRFIPGLILIAAVFVTYRGLDAQISAWEPFNAWIWYIAGTASLVLAVLSLCLSAVVPMGWCRYGCGTGRLLEYVRHSARATRLTIADGVLIALTVIAWSQILFPELRV